MKVVIYDQDKILHVVDNVRSPVVTDDAVSWEDGSFIGIKFPFLVLEDDVVCSEINDELITLDKKTEFKKVDYEKENKSLVERLESAEKKNEMNAFAIMELAELLMGGGE